MTQNNFARWILPLTAAATLFPWIGSGTSLILGTAFALTLGNPYQDRTKKMTHNLLALSVMGLGAGMNLGVIGRVGLSGIGYTVAGILSAVALGTLIGRALKTAKDTSLLITLGTAICGGSAIAAIAPVIRAKHHEVSVALGTVFLLNAVGLFTFPWIGHHLDLTQTQFGLWSALAIHDTSSVVGATLQYGAQALEVGTTVKLARALWIVPVAMIVGIIRSRQNPGATGPVKGKRPWFIVGFIVAAAVVTWIPALQPLGHQIESIAKRMMVLTLFLIGTSLTRETIKSVGIKPFVQGVILWILMASGSLWAIYEGIIGG